jgi:hypothetical protein
LTPPVESSGASFLENCARGEGAFLIEVVVNGAVDCGALLQASHAMKAKHRRLPSSQWLAGILDAINHPTADIALVPQ